MRKLLTALVLVAAVQMASAQKKQYQLDIVAFYNLENLFDTINDPEKNDEDFLPNGANQNNTYVYTDKLGKLSRVLSEIGTDISPDGFALVGVAEVENRKVLEDLVMQPKLKDRNLRIVHHSSPDARGIDVAMLYNPKYFKLKSSHSLFVPLKDEATGKYYYTRDILWATGELSGETVHVFVNHWPSRRGGEAASAPSRAIAAGVCRHVIDSLMQIDPNTKVIVMGDLNDDPNNASVTQVLGAKTEKSEVQPGGIYNPWWDFLKKGIGTLAYDDSWNLFDQIMFSYGFLNQNQTGFFLQQAHIYNKQYMVNTNGRFKGYPMRTYNGSRYAGGYSDHFPTYCVLLKATETK